MQLQKTEQPLPARWPRLDLSHILGRLGIIVALALAGLASAVWLTGHRASSPPAPAVGSEGVQPARPLTPSGETHTVALARIPQWIEVTGSVRPELEATVGTKVSGRVVRVLAREGDAVRRGQPLVLLDRRDLDAAVVQADANLRAAQVGRQTAHVAATMEDATSKARIAAAEAQLGQSEAAFKAAVARQEMVEAGPRRQERASASLAVAQAKSNLTLAETNLKRISTLVAEGAVSQQYFDSIKAQYEVAKAQYETARQSESMTDEGSRAEEIRSAREAVRQAQAAVDQAKAGLQQARAATLQTAVRRQEIAAAEAQIWQSRAAKEIAQVARDYATVVAPFDGVVSQKLADPGTLAGPGTPLMRIQGGAIRLETVVPESALARVRRSDRLPVRLDALAGKEAAGSVAEVAPQGDPSSHTFTVKLDLPASLGARAGMFGRARIRTGIEEALLVPAEAVAEREGLHFVTVVGADGRDQLRLVTAGETRNGQVRILSGLNAGEKIRVARVVARK